MDHPLGIVELFTTGEKEDPAYNKLNHCDFLTPSFETKYGLGESYNLNDPIYRYVVRPPEFSDEWEFKVLIPLELIL